MSQVRTIICPNCHSACDATNRFCGNCRYPLTGTVGNHSTVSNQQPQQGRITRVFDELLDDTLPTFTPQPPSRPARNKRRVVVLSVLVLLLIGAAYIGAQIGKGSSPVTGNTPQNTLSRNGSPDANTPLANGNGPTTIAVSTLTPIPQSTPSPIPSPTSQSTAVPAGTVICYTANPGQGWDKWNLVTGWKILNGELLYDGTGNGEKLVAPDFCQPTTPNYAVDVRMRIVAACCHFGIWVRGSASTNGDTGYEVSIYTTTYQNVFISTHGGQGGASGGYSFDNNFHVYRAEVKDNIINFLIDRAKVLSATDNTFLIPGEVSICCTDTMEMEISSFKVTAL